jgi:hypothetical protein
MDRSMDKFVFPLEICSLLLAPALIRIVAGIFVWPVPNRLGLNPIQKEKKR